MKAIKTIVRKYDSWTNVLTGLGTEVRDKLESTIFSRGATIDDETLEALYHSDDMAARIVEAPVDEMTRAGFTVQVEGEEGKDESTGVEMKLDDLGVTPAVSAAMTWGRLFGGGGVYMLIDDGQSPDQPVNESTIRTISGLVVFDKRDLLPHSYYTDTQDPRFGKVKTFRVQSIGTVQGVARSSIEIHESRLLIFEGVRITDRYRARNSGWGVSVIQRVYAPLRNFQSTWASVAHLMTDANQGVFSVKGLIDMIASDQKDALQARMEVVDMGRSVARALLIDADGEKFERQSASFAGIPEVLQQSMLRLSGAARIPVTILMGQSPAGLNATGESDLRWWYDSIASAQVLVLQPALERLIKLVFLSQDGPTNGEEPEHWTIQFAPLWEPTPEETAALRKSVAETDKIYIDSGVVLPEEVTLSRFPAGGWSAEMNVDLDVRRDVLAQERATGADPEAADPTSAFNGAQVAALQEIVLSVSRGEIPKDTAARMMTVAFPLSEKEAARILAPVKPQKPAAQG